MSVNINGYTFFSMEEFSPHICFVCTSMSDIFLSVQPSVAIAANVATKFFYNGMECPVSE